MSERQGIEIDYCPKCRGVWLDRGELDKIVERSAAEAPETQRRAPQPEQPYPPERGYYEGGHGGHGKHGGGHGYGRRRGWLGDIFD